MPADHVLIVLQLPQLRRGAVLRLVRRRVESVYVRRAMSRLVKRCLIVRAHARDADGVLIVVVVPDASSCPRCYCVPTHTEGLEGTATGPSSGSCAAADWFYASASCPTTVAVAPKSRAHAAVALTAATNSVTIKK